MNAAWQQREEARRRLRAEPYNSNLRKTVKMMAGKNLRKVCKGAVLSFFWAFVRKPETCVREGDQAGLYKHLKTMSLNGKRDRSLAHIQNEDILRLNSSANDGFGGSTFFSTSSHEGSTRTSATALTSGPRTCRERLSDRTEFLLSYSRSSSTGFRSATETARYRRLCLEGGEVPQQWKYATILVLTQKEELGRVRQLQGYLARNTRRQDTAAENHRSPPQ